MGRTGITSNRSDFVGRVRHYQDTVPRVNRDAANKAGWAVKRAWIPLAQTYGLGTGNLVARRKWSVTDTVKGGVNASSIVSYQGPVHLVIGSTIPHIIGARLLNTRGSSYKTDKMTGAKVRVTRAGSGFAGKQAKLGANKAFGGSNRGVLGKIKTHNLTKGGAIKSERKGAKALTWGGGGQFAAYTFHPGTKGKPGLWTESKRLAIAIGPKVYREEHRKALAKEFVGGTKSILGALK